MEKEEWNCFTVAPGGQFVTIAGTSTTHESFVVHWAILALTVLLIVLTSVKELVRYGWTMSGARVTKLLFRVAPTMDGMYIIAVTVKTRQSFVQVNITLNYLSTV